MPTSIEYSTDDKLQKVIDDLIASKKQGYLSSLRDHKVAVIGVFALKHNAKGEEQRSDVPVILKKVPEVFQTWVYASESTNPAKFVLIVDYLSWNDANAKQREIMLHEVLSTIKAKQAEDKVKFSILKLPRFNPYTIATYGQYNESVVDLAELCTNAAGEASTAAGRMCGEEKKKSKLKTSEEEEEEEEGDEEANKNGAETSVEENEKIVARKN
jgi:hypothetical protein